MNKENCVLKKAEIRPRFTTGNDHDRKGKNGTKERRRRVRYDERELKKDGDKLTHDPHAPQQQQLPFDEGVEESSTHIKPAQTQAAELALEPRKSNSERSYFSHDGRTTDPGSPRL